MPKITFAETGATHEVPAGTPLLDFCQSTETPTRFGCSSGACGTCVSIVAGDPGSLTELTDDERDVLERVTDADGARLLCICELKGDITISPIL